MLKILVMFYCLALLPSSARADRQAYSLKSIGWLLGEWKSMEQNLVCTETWVQVSPSTWEGTGETRTAGDQTISSETLRMLEMSGQVFYLAKSPENRWPVPFLLIECSAQHAVFSNQEHAFPQRLEYRLENASTLLIRAGGQGREISLRLKRQKNRSQ